MSNATTRTVGVVGVMGVCAALAAAGEVYAQHRPGSLGELRWRLEEARGCHVVLDEGCVIERLEGPLLGRLRLPEGFGVEETIEAHELLGLAYIASGLEEDGRRVFERLLMLAPDYRLTRPDLPPEHSRLIESLADELRLRRQAQDFATNTAQSAAQIAISGGMQRVAAALFARWQARQFALQTKARATRQAPLMLSPPWGPLRGPFFSLGGGFQWLLGSDEPLWSYGWGLNSAVSLVYAPLFIRWSVLWFRHEALTSSDIESTPPTMSQIGATLHLGWYHGWKQLSWTLSGGLGIEAIYIDDFLSSVNPTFHARASALWWFIPTLAFELDLNQKWIFGPSPENAITTTSLSTTTALMLGLCYEF